MVEEIDSGRFEHKTRHQLECALMSHIKLGLGRIDLKTHMGTVEHAKQQFRGFLDLLLSGEYKIDSEFIRWPKKKHKSLQGFLHKMKIAYKKSDFDWSNSYELDEFVRRYG